MEFLVAFTFTTAYDTDTLAAQLIINGGNIITLSSNQQIQIQSAAPLASFFVAQPKNQAQPSIALQAMSNVSHAQQSVKVVVPIQPEGANLTGNFPFNGVTVNLQYQFIGYASAGSIAVGDFSIPFPTS